MDDRGGAASQLDVADHLRVLQRRKWVIVVTTVVMVATAVGVALGQDPIYRARAELQLAPPVGGSLPGASIASDWAETEVEVLQSGVVRHLVRQQLGQAPPVLAAQVPGSEIIRG